MDKICSKDIGSVIFAYIFSHVDFDHFLCGATTTDNDLVLFFQIFDDWFFESHYYREYHYTFYDQLACRHHDKTSIFLAKKLIYNNRIREVDSLCWYASYAERYNVVYEIISSKKWITCSTISQLVKRRSGIHFACYNGKTFPPKYYPRNSQTKKVCRRIKHAFNQSACTLLFFQ